MSEDDKPKLIIDEGWKSQVEREREELRLKQEAADAEAKKAAEAKKSASAENDAGGQSPEESEPSAGDSSRGGTDRTAAHSEGKSSLPPPPASMAILVTMLATQAMAALGLINEENEQPTAPDIHMARHFIDLLSVLEEKTKGNLDNNDASYLAGSLHQLRLAFVAVSKQAQSSGSSHMD